MVVSVCFEVRRLFLAELLAVCDLVCLTFAVTWSSFFRLFHEFLVGL